MYLLLKWLIFQPAMLVYWMVSVFGITLLGNNTYPTSRHFWVDDFLNFPDMRYLSFSRLWCFYDWGFLWIATNLFGSLMTIIDEILTYSACKSLISRKIYVTNFTGMLFKVTPRFTALCNVMFFKNQSTICVLHDFWKTNVFFPERRFVAGFFRRLLAYLTPHISHTYLTPHISHTYLTPHISHTYLTPHISHTYPSHHTYPIHIHSKRIPPIRIPPIRIRSTRIPPVRIHAMWSFQNVCISRFCNTYPTNTYPFNTYPTNTYPCYAYPFNAYPFKRCASAGIANVSHQYISHQYVSSTRIPPVRVHSMRIHSKSLHQQEWQWVWVSLHIISYHCYSAGMVMNIETLLFLQFFAKLLIEYNCIARVWTWNSLLAIGLPACLPVVCFCACF